MRLGEEQETELTLNRCPEGLFDKLRTKPGVGNRLDATGAMTDPESSESYERRRQTGPCSWSSQETLGTPLVMPVLRASPP
jgi:hypothetical protein